MHPQANARARSVRATSRKPARGRRELLACATARLGQLKLVAFALGVGEAAFVVGMTRRGVGNDFATRRQALPTPLTIFALIETPDYVHVFTAYLCWKTSAIPRFYALEAAKATHLAARRAMDCRSAAGKCRQSGMPGRGSRRAAIVVACHIRCSAAHDRAARRACPHQELQDSMEHPARMRAQSGLRPAKRSLLG